MESGKKIYILGAGCSASSGYPLGNGFVAALDSFAKTLTGPEKQQIKRAVDETVQLLKSKAIATLDELVARINTGALDDPSHSPIRKEQRCHERIYDAKVSTLALFVSLEPAARKTGLASYTSFLREIFPGHDHWMHLLRHTDCHVLSFNYDRLFEMAFLSLFRPDTGRYPVYSAQVLNSGLTLMQKRAIGFDHNRFCFLKLHGSVGMAAREEHGEPSHYQDSQGPTLDAPTREVVDKDFFPRLAKNPNGQKAEPLIVFPHEKDFVRSNRKNGFPYREYITKVWDQAEKLVSGASEIWIIGYSFSPIDRPSFLRLLKAGKSCKRIVVQNPIAKELCNNLSKKFSDLRLPLDPFETPF